MSCEKDVAIKIKLTSSSSSPSSPFLIDHLSSSPNSSFAHHFSSSRRLHQHPSWRVTRRTTVARRRNPATALHLSLAWLERLGLPMLDLPPSAVHLIGRRPLLMWFNSPLISGQTQVFKAIVFVGSLILELDLIVRGIFTTVQSFKNSNWAFLAQLV